MNGRNATPADFSQLAGVGTVPAADYHHHRHLRGNGSSFFLPGQACPADRIVDSDLPGLADQFSGNPVKPFPGLGGLGQDAKLFNEWQAFYIIPVVNHNCLVSGPSQDSPDFGVLGRSDHHYLVALLRQLFGPLLHPSHEGARSVDDHYTLLPGRIKNFWGHPVRPDQHRSSPGLAEVVNDSDAFSAQVSHNVRVMDQFAQGAYRPICFHGSPGMLQRPPDTETESCRPGAPDSQAGKSTPSDASRACAYKTSIIEISS